MHRPLPNEIRTGRLVLRAPLISDADAIFDGYATDHEVCKYMVWTPHESREFTGELMSSFVEAWQDGPRMPYVIVKKGSNNAIGMLEARIAGPVVDLGFVLARMHWGQGLMTEAIDALADNALSHPAVFRVQAICEVGNLASRRTLEKSGFRLEALLQRYAVFPALAAEPRTCVIFSKCR